MTDETRRAVERIAGRQRRFWMRLLMTILVTAFVCIVVVALAVFFISREMERRQIAETERTLENFISKPFQIDIPVHYEISVDMGLEVMHFKRGTVTCYNNERRQTDSTPNHTATGRLVYEGSVAVSQDIFKKTLFPGDIVYIVKLKQYFIVEDTMNARHKNAFDIFFYIQNAGKMHNTFTSDILGIRTR